MNGNFFFLPVLLSIALSLRYGAAVSAQEAEWSELSQPRLKKLIEQQAARCENRPTFFRPDCLRQLSEMEAEYDRRRQQLQTTGFVLPQDYPGNEAAMRAMVERASRPRRGPRSGIVSREEEERRKADDPFYTGGELDF